MRALRHPACSRAGREAPQHPTSSCTLRGPRARPPQAPPPGAQQLLGPQRLGSEAEAGDLGAGACAPPPTPAFLPGRPRGSVWPFTADPLPGRRRGRIMPGQAHGWHLPRCAHFLSRGPQPPAPPPPAAPLGCASIVGAFSSLLSSGQDRVSLAERGRVFAGAAASQRYFVGASWTCLCSCGETGDALAPPQTEIDVASLPGAPKETLCSVSAPFRLSPFMRELGPCHRDRCRRRRVRGGQVRQLARASPPRAPFP